jgi:pilus assembly protein CpaB
MSMRTVLVLILALVCGGTAAIGISALLRPAPAAAAPEEKVEAVPVVVAAMDLGKYTTLTPEMIKVRMIAKDSIHPNAAAKAEDVLERTLLQPVVKGEAILLVDSKLAPKGSGRGIEAAIPEGMRAVTVLTQNQAAGVAGFVLPGSKVDVLLTMSLPNSINDTAGSPKTFVLLEDVEVLASQKFVQNPENNLNVGELQYVTLLVNQDQAKMVSLSQNRSGQLQMVLRNPTDKQLVSRKVLTLADLEPESSRPKPAPAQEKIEPVAAPKAPPKPGQIRIIRGLSESVVPVEPPAALAENSER